jgi:hypothetical protein
MIRSMRMGRVRHVTHGKTLIGKFKQKMLLGTIFGEN